MEKVGRVEREEEEDTSIDSRREDASEKVIGVGLVGVAVEVLVDGSRPIALSAYSVCGVCGVCGVGGVDGVVGVVGGLVEDEGCGGGGWGKVGCLFLSMDDWQPVRRLAFNHSACRRNARRIS